MARRLEPRSSADPDVTRGETAVYLGLIVAAALVLRVWFSYGLVVTPGGVNFQDNDSWYHARVVDNIARHWPSWLRGDPYAINGGQRVPLAPLLDFSVAGAAVLLGLGRPSPHFVEIVAAWAPAVLGALISVPIFLAGRRIFDQRAGLFGAALVALLPGHLLERSRFGYLDHHVMEALLAATTLCLVVRALQQPAVRAQAIAGAWAGLGLGAYLLSWSTGSYLVGILIAGAVVHYLAAAVRGGESAAPAIVLATTALAALAIVVALQDRSMYRYDFQVASLGIAAATAVGLESLRLAIARSKLPPATFVAGAAILAVVAFLAAERIAPNLIGGLRSEIARAAPDSSAFTVVEAMPLAAYVRAPWMQIENPFLVFGTGLPLGLAGLVLMTLGVLRRPVPERTLVVVWTIVVLGSTLLRNRFGYYLVPMLALLGGWVCAIVLARLERRPRLRDLAIVTVGALAFAPNIWPAHRQVRQDAGMSPGWAQSMTWLRDHTPEPFDDPGYYYARYPAGQPLKQPDYSVMAWWDYGYWVMRGARRVPVANPTQLGAQVAGVFFMTEDPAEAARILDSNKSRYVVVDHQLPFRLVAPPQYLMGKFEDVVTWAGKRAADYYEGMYVRGERGQMNPAVVFYPAYYRTMMNRLYQFGGRAVIPTASHVISYAERRHPDGTPFKEITAMQSFPSHAAAQAYLQSLGPGAHRLVGLQPNESPVPLEDLPDFYREFASQQPGPWAGSSSVYVYQFRRLTP